MMLAAPGELVAAKLAVARRAHVLGIVLAIGVGTLRDLHGHCSLLLWLLDLLWFRNLLRSLEVGDCENWSVFLFIGFLVEELLLHEVLEEFGI